MTGGYVFTGIYPSTLAGGGGGTPSQVRMGEYPIPRSGWGYSIPGQDGRGYPIPGLDWGGYPIPDLDGGNPIQGLDGRGTSSAVRTGGTQDWMG